MEAVSGLIPIFRNLSQSDPWLDQPGDSSQQGSFTGHRRAQTQAFTRIQEVGTDHEG